MSNIQQFIYDDSFFNDGSSLLSYEHNNGHFVKSEGYYLVKTYDGIKKKQLQLGQQCIRYSSKKYIQFTNSQLQQIALDSNTLGVRLRKNDNEIEIYGIPTHWMKLLKKFTIQFDFFQRFKLVSLIYKGLNATVYKILNIENKEYYAAKVFEKKKILASTELIQFIELEISTLRQVTHKNLISLFETYEDKNCIILVLTYCKGGELTKMVNKYGVSECEVQAIMKPLLSVVNSLHQQKIFHRDIKLSNILFLDQNIPQSLILSDLGLSERFDKQELTFKKCGTVGYTAPEILIGRKYDEKIDMFSLGVVMYILLTGKEPFQGRNYEEKKRLNQQCEISQINMNNSRNCLDLLQKLLEQDPKKRISCQEAILHPFMLYGSGNHCYTESLKPKHSKLSSLKISLITGRDSITLEDSQQQLTSKTPNLKFLMSNIHSLSTTPRLPYL